jgi:uncharacterized lipoprotein YddW (UPF0748 family)
MHRRTFLEMVTGTLAGAMFAPNAGAEAAPGGADAANAAGAAQSGRAADAPPAPRADFLGWTWVHGNARGDAAAWRARFARIRAAGITGVLVSDGDTALLAEAARAEGLAFHRWMWICNRSGDAAVKANHPDWFSVSRNGDSSLTKPPYVPYYQWVCPSRPEVREYLRGVVDEMAQVPGVAGVHLDYIRHPDVILPKGLWAKYNLVQDHEMPEFDFCYCSVCRAGFKAQTGLDPMALPDPTANQAWREFRWASVTGLVEVLSRAVRARGKVISAAVFPTPTIARTLVRQAWEMWPLDLVFPMVYHGFYQETVPWIGTAVREGVSALAGRGRLYAGLYLPDLPVEVLGRAIAAAKDGGAAGVSLFDMNGLTDGHLAVVQKVVGGG